MRRVTNNLIAIGEDIMAIMFGYINNIITFVYRVSIKRVECKFNNHGSDFTLDSVGIEHLTTILVNNDIMSPNATIIISGECGLWL